MSVDVQRNTPRLQPTLWRTCRVLANLARLRMIHHLVDNPGHTVSEVSEAVEMSLPQTSISLRALNARGLLQAERVSRWVHYRVAPDPTIPETGPLIEAMKRVFDQEDQPETLIFRNATAYTHPRRVLIVALLKRHGSLSFAEIRNRTGMSRDALLRHLQKLNDRGLVQRVEGLWFLVQPKGTLAKVLLRFASSK